MTKSLRICLLASGRIFEFAVGGEDKFTLSFGDWLAKRGHDVILMGSGFASIKAKRLSEFSIEEEREGVIITEQKKIRILYPPYFIYLLSRFVMSLLWTVKISSINMRFPITLIHAQDTGYSGLAAVLSGKFLRIPVVLSSHGIRHKTLESTIHGRLKDILLNFEYKLDIFTVKNADRIIAVNPSIKKYFEQITSKEIQHIPITIKSTKFQFSEAKRNLIRKELGIEDNTKVIGYVGRFSPEKNLLTLLISFANLVQDANLSMKLVLVGATGPLESQLREYICKRGIEDYVIICGVRHDIDRILSSFDVFALPSYAEGLSTALLEAMACGRPIICSDINANQELVTHNKEGLLVNPSNIKGFEQAIRLLCADDSLRVRLGNNARIKASQYDEEIVFPRILQYYEVLSKRDTIQSNSL